MNQKKLFLTIVAAAILLPAVIVAVVSIANGINTEKPCDIYAKGGTPCVTAHSTTRVLSSKYDGPLYQVRRESDGKTLDIGTIKGGFADAASQDMFCENTMCYVTVIYDQSGMGNDLMPAAPGTFKGPDKGEFNTMSIADMAPITISGHKVYGLYIMPGMGYRNNNAQGLAINDDPEGIYYVINGKHFDSGCCFDYGNSSTNGKAVGTGTMETTYYGTSTAWGSGNDEGPWIMADMEGGLFSGYNAKKNDVPSIDSWQFVSVFVNGGGGNQWDLRGGDATVDSLITYYSGVRPGSSDNDSYYPMNKKGGVLLGNGGDNGNGSAGTFYEGVMTVGYPSDEVVNKVQKNIADARYAEQYVAMSRLTSFTPSASQELVVTFTNSTDKAVAAPQFNIDLPEGWISTQKSVVGEGDKVATGQRVAVTYQITAPTSSMAAYLKASVSWNGTTESLSQRVRCAEPIKINEISLSQDKQFIELYNSSDAAVDMSGWSLVVTRSGWAAVKNVVIPPATVLQPKEFYLIESADSYLTVPTKRGDKSLFLSNTDNLKAGSVIEVGGQKVVVAETGTGASEFTTIFIPVSTDPQHEISAGATNIPVTSITGVETGQKMGIDLGGNYEVVTVTSVGKAGTQTTLAEPVTAGQSTIKLASTANLEPGFELTIGTGQRTEKAIVKQILKQAIEPIRVYGQRSEPGVAGEVELEKALTCDQINGVDVSCLGSGIDFEPALKFSHRSGDAIQYLGGGVLLKDALEQDHELLSPIKLNGEAGLLFGYKLSPTAGSIGLYDKSGEVLVDGVVYGSQQSNSSGDGTIASPAIATLEGVQSQGGCIAVVPRRMFFRPGTQPVVNAPETSLIRFPDGNDTDNLCSDFISSTTLTPGKQNLRSVKP